MDAAQFDTVARWLVDRQGRRRFAQMLAGIATVPLLAIEVDAGKKKPKKKPVCLNGETIKAAGKKRKKLIESGATPGACAGGCTPQCDGIRCGDDGCGGTCGCGAGSVCHEGSCSPCTVTCTGTPLACGTRLKLALQDGGTIVVCPGHYGGGVAVRKNTTLIGAGSGSDPARNTIIDSQGGPSVFSVYPGDSSVTFMLSGVRVTGANAVGFPGGGVFGEQNTDVRLTNCVVAGNKASMGGGIFAGGALRLTNSTVTGNESTTRGGGIYLRYRAQSHIDNVVIEGNTAALYGGGLYAQETNVTVTGTEVRGNHAQRGGGIAIEESVFVTLDGATSITNNTASQLGGGVARFSGTFNQNGATIRDNRLSNGTVDNCAGVDCT